MSSFSCPYQVDDQCKRVKIECLPGQTGCVLKGKVVFAESEDPAPKPKAKGRKAVSGKKKGKR